MNAFERVLFRLLEEILHSSRSILTFVYQWHALTNVAYVIRNENTNFEKIFQFFFLLFTIRKEFKVLRSSLFKNLSRISLSLFEKKFLAPFSCSGHFRPCLLNTINFARLSFATCLTMLLIVFLPSISFSFWSDFHCYWSIGDKGHRTKQN